MIDSLGIIGTGHLSEFVCEGLRASGWAHELVVSPHNRTKAALFHQRFDASIAETHQQLVDRTQAVFVAVKPAQIKQALSDIVWPAHQIIISAAAGVKVSDLADIVTGANIVRVMPISAAALMASPTTLFPNHPLVAELLAQVGPVIPLASELEFDAATANAAAYGWYFALMDEIMQANVRAGLTPDSAKRISIETLAAAAKVSLASTKDCDSILEGLATPGGITEQGLDILKQQQAIECWGTAFGKIVERLTQVKK
jgi:pyrroline-5-carboxylate reductase